jgi:hypothetical protein
MLHTTYLSSWEPEDGRIRQKHVILIYKCNSNFRIFVFSRTYQINITKLYVCFPSFLSHGKVWVGWVNLQQFNISPFWNQMRNLHKIFFNKINIFLFFRRLDNNPCMEHHIKCLCCNKERPCHTYTYKNLPSLVTLTSPVLKFWSRKFSQSAFHNSVAAFRTHSQSLSSHYVINPNNTTINL